MTPLEAAAAWASSSDTSTRVAGALALDRLILGAQEEEA